jgi:hypothetical protein
MSLSSRKLLRLHLWAYFAFQRAWIFIGFTTFPRGHCFH